jgi:O-antigen/teichoic acid export membrane protein
VARINRRAKPGPVQDVTNAQLTPPPSPSSAGVSAAVDTVPHEVMHGGEIRRRAVAGVATVTVRGAAIRVMGFAGTVVLARLLAPHDFGLVAFGATLMVFARYLADGGIGAALIRGPVGPDRADLQAFLGLQLVATTGFAGAAAIAATRFGTEGTIVAVMVAALPLTVLRMPGAIVLERNLRYGPLVFIEILETLVYFVWAIGTIVLFGWGVWGLATGAIVRAAAAAVAMTIVSPVGLPAPTLSWRRVRTPLLFGVRFQGIGLVRLVGDQGVNIGTAVIGSISILGVWNLAGRLLSVPYLAFESLWRVGYPAMARLLGTGEDPRPVLERGTALVATANGAVLAPLVGATPALIPAVFGAKWNQAVFVMPWACLGLMVSGPISVTAAGYLTAVGDVKAVLRGTVLSESALAVVALPLLPLIGVTALGLGAMAAAFAECVVFARAVTAHSRASITAPLVVPTIAATAAGAIGWAVASSLPATLLVAFIGGLSAEALYLGSVFAIRKDLVVDMTGMLNRMIRTSLAGA